MILYVRLEPEGLNSKSHFCLDFLPFPHVKLKTCPPGGSIILSVGSPVLRIGNKKNLGWGREGDFITARMTAAVPESFLFLVRLTIRMCRPKKHPYILYTVHQSSADFLPKRLLSMHFLTMDGWLVDTGTFYTVEQLVVSLAEGIQSSILFFKCFSNRLSSVSWVKIC